MMADEQNEQQQMEAEAAKKQAVPDSVQINGGNAPVERAEYLKMVESHKDTVKKYGETSFDSFMTKIGSDGGFAQRVVMDQLNGGETENVGTHPDAPQENNLTGRIDRTVETPTRVKFEGQSEAKPSSVA